MNYLIRCEEPRDTAAIRQVEEAAFERPEEADLVDRLRQSCPEQISWVAEVDGQVVGHTLFTPMYIEGPGGRLEGMGLGPVAVLPEYQRQGVGGQMIRAGLAELAAAGSAGAASCPYVIVLGHPEYYPRFGFLPASHYGVQCEYEGVPGEAFMLLELQPAALQGVSGVAYYRPEFSGV